MIYGDVKMKAGEIRREEIEKYIFVNEEAQVNELAKMFDVTPETIRTDLALLEQKGVLHRTHGGAVIRMYNNETPMEIRKKERTEQKRKISYEAINYVKDDDFVFIDSSSTAFTLGRLLRLRKNLTIITNSYDLLLIIASTDHKVIFLGGVYSRLGKRTEGSYAIDMIDSLSYDVAFIGMDGCAGIDGPATIIEDARNINRHVMRRSKRNVLISDNTKFSKDAKYQYAKFEEFDVLITDYVPKGIEIKGVKIIETEK